MSTDAVRAALAELVAATVPDGWQLVPKEPTLEMLRAAVQVKEGPAVERAHGITATDAQKEGA